jgi:S-ribosylhomocysteine lyase
MRAILRYDKTNSKKEHPMEKITSFTIDHIKLQPGLYVSRKDKIGAETVTTFDLRLTSPNEEPVMNTAEMHTIEHLAATYLRNEANWKERVLYFGPMGCRTGFYLLLTGDLSSEDALPLVRDCFRFIADFSGEVPGASAKDCGNYLDMNLPMANYWSRRYAALLENIPADRLVYPE